MFEYTKDNHHAWSIDGVDFAWHTGPDHLFDARHGKVNPSQVFDFRTEVNKTVECIRASVSDEIFVTFSGGIDGEVICRSFIECGYKVTPLTYVYKYGVNEYDVGYARDFCKKFDIKGIEIEIDIMDFWHNQVDLYCEKYMLPHWICTWKAFLFDSFDGFLIQAQGWPQLLDVNGQLLIKEDSHHMNPLVLSGQAGIGEFYKYRPELTYSWLTDPDVYRWSGLMQKPFESIGQEKHFKFFALSKFYLDDKHPLALREKRTGMETIGKYANDAMHKCRKRYENNVKIKTWNYASYLNLISI
jgi:hypothetical protein